MYTHTHRSNKVMMMVPPLSMMEMWTTVGSSIASFMFVWAMLSRYCPYELRRYFERYTHRLSSLFYPYIRVSIHEYTGAHLKRSEAYASVEAYLSVSSSKSAKRLKAVMGRDNKKLELSMDENERVTDEFEGVKVWWVSCKSVPPQRPMSYQPEPDRRYYKLTFHKRYREMITETYLEHVVKKGKEVRRRNKQRKLYTNCPNRWLGHKQTMWSHIVFEHPATFDMMAMEAEKKKDIIEDLLTFSRSKDFYARIGKAWKRGYLLYGPPGTGKSTMIAAMANLLSYDVYDLELTAVKDNTELRRLLIETTRKSIIVIEDIDCSLDLTGQRKKKEEKSSEDEKGKKDISHKEHKEESSSGGSKVTLSGLLNFIDGLWSACGGERIIVFTTNYVEKLDPALTRRGRMDKHIELSYCSFEGFTVLAKNYLEIEEHPMFEKVRELLRKTKITPADVAENLMPKSATEDAEICLSSLIRALEETKDEVKEKKEPANQDALQQDKQEAEKSL